LLSEALAGPAASQQRCIGELEFQAVIPLADIPVIDAPDGPLHLARLQAAKLPHLLKIACEILPAPLLR
jgi:hypothetical protein